MSAAAALFGGYPYYAMEGRPASEALPPSDRPLRRSRSRSVETKDEYADAEAFVLPNGIKLHDRPPGNVSRYKHYKVGAWQAARILLYSFIGFPQLLQSGPSTVVTGITAAGPSTAVKEEPCELETEEHEPAPGDSSGSISSVGVQQQYDWKKWLAKLNDYPKDLAGFRECAVYLTTRRADSISSAFVTDVAKAVIELVLRDAEYSRLGWRPTPKSQVPAQSTVLGNETVLMSRIRTAHAYKPRAQEVEKAILQAIEVHDAAALQRIAATAPDSHLVHALVRRKRL